ncbi:MAG TPA: hypothetical protein VJ945_06180 [Flavobacteriaceae bacterium]|nr:hypothetical protein [Flavobacteriaceae bacterium]
MKEFLWIVLGAMVVAIFNKYIEPNMPDAKVVGKFLSGVLSFIGKYLMIGICIYGIYDMTANYEFDKMYVLTIAFLFSVVVFQLVKIELSKKK